MSKQLHLEISDQVYENLQQEASAVGLSATEWILALINAQQGEASTLNKPDKQARKGFRSFAGDLKKTGGTDNKSIDADIAEA